jgi:hypothetical protein
VREDVQNTYNPEAGVRFEGKVIYSMLTNYDKFIPLLFENVGNNPEWIMPVLRGSSRYCKNVVAT